MVTRYDLTITKRYKKNEGRNGEEAGLKEAITIFQRWNKNDGD